jgi:SAM-dependent methyltransferase
VLRRVKKLISRTGLPDAIRAVINRLYPPSRAFAVSRRAQHHCVGQGIEIGASAQNPFGLRTRNVDFTGSMDTVFKLEEKRLVGRAARVDIVASADSIPLSDSSEDFVVSSHVLEHVVDPVRCLLEWDRIVKPGGVIFMIIPHKERTADDSRPRTNLKHLVEDYEQGCTVSSVPEGGHEHVWVTEDIVELILWMQANTGVCWRLLEVADTDDKVGNGFTVVIRKLTQRSGVATTALPEWQ